MLQPLEPTLKETFQTYLDTKNLKPKSRKVYQQVFHAYLAPFHDLPLTLISPESVLQHHKTLPKIAGNLAMRLLRALFNFADVKPATQIMTKNKTWNREKRRKTHLTTGEDGTIREFIKGANALKNSDLRDYLLFLLFTGLRRNEASQLSWDNVNLKAATITLPDTKNGENITLPMNSYALAILTAREPGNRLSENLVFKSSASTQCLRKVGVSFCLHDLRRTFMTVGDELDMSPGLIKQLVNHKSNDVTEGYLCRSIERLRKASQQIGDFMVSHQVKPI